MEAKIFEVRDRGTFVPMLAVQLKPDREEDRYLLARMGYGRTPEEQRCYVVLWALAGGDASTDPNYCGGRTRPTAHRYIAEKWLTLISGDVIDVEFILGETTTMKCSEAVAVHPPSAEAEKEQ